jgi:hypothetical protein
MRTRASVNHVSHLVTRQVYCSRPNKMKVGVFVMTLIRIAESNLGIAEFHSSNDYRMFNTQVVYTTVSRVT